MTAYKAFWNREIELLLNQLNAPDSLRDNVVDTIANIARTGLHPNQIVNALRIGVSIKEGNQNMAFIASMQSGKSGTVYFLCNYVLPAIGLLAEHDTVLFVTSMRDTDLYDQNCNVLHKEFYDVSVGEMKDSRIIVMKMGEFFKHPNPHKVVNDYDVQLIVRDEDQYGCGEESSFQVAFFDNLRNRMPDIKLLSVSATPYDILDAQYRGVADVDVVVGLRPPNYYGITEMLEDGLVQDLPENFRPLVVENLNDEQIFSAHPLVLQYVDYLMEFNDGLGVIRESKTHRALELRNLLRNRYRHQVEVVAIGSDQLCDFGINEGLKTVRDLIMRRRKRVVLIVVQALTAGKDLGQLKERVRFGIEPRDSQLANGAQGITGRFCGYHNNRTFKLLASKELLEHYAKFEQDWEVFADEKWRNELFNGNVRGLTTHTKFELNNREGIFTPIEEIVEISYDDLFTDEGRDRLGFIDDEAYFRILHFFSPEFYDSDTKGTRLNQKGVTIRLASSYSAESNRVYRNWHADKSKDFGSVFFKKHQYRFGLLINNYPENHPKNTIGFQGIKIFLSGQREYRLQQTNVLNRSMYNQDAVLN